MTISYKVVSSQHGAAWFDCPALLQRTEGCTITSKALPPGSLLSGVHFGYDYVLNLKGLSPLLAQSRLGGVIQSSLLGPAVTHTGTAVSAMPGSSLFPSLLSEVVSCCAGTHRPILGENPKYLQRRVE